MPSEHDLEAVLFDLDNTLIPFLGPLRRWARAWARAARPEEPDPVCEALLDITLDETEDPERAVRVVADAFDLLDEAEHASQQAQQVYWRALVPYPGVRAMLAQLARANTPMGIVTDAPRKRAATRLSATQLTRFFDVVVTRDDSEQGKQSPRPFWTALDELDVGPLHAVMVGDWPAFDIRWPNRIGMRSVLAGWGATALPEHAQCQAEAWFEADDPRQVSRLVVDGLIPETARTPAPTLQASIV